MTGAKALSSIVSGLFDNEEIVADRAVVALVNLSKKEKKAVNLLLRSLKQAKSKSKVLLALSQIAIEEVDAKIQKKICKELSYYKNVSDKHVYLEMAKALRSYDISVSNDMMRELSNDKDVVIRKIALEILVEWDIEI
jgi:hypothetical protein